MKSRYFYRRLTFQSNMGKIINKMKNLAIKMRENTCLYSYSSLHCYSFLRKTSPSALIQAYTRIIDCRVYRENSLSQFFRENYVKLTFSLLNYSVWSLVVPNQMSEKFQITFEGEWLHQFWCHLGILDRESYLILQIRFSNFNNQECLSRKSKSKS